MTTLGSARSTAARFLSSVWQPELSTRREASRWRARATLRGRPRVCTPLKSVRAGCRFPRGLRTTESSFAFGRTSCEGFRPCASDCLNRQTDTRRSPKGASDSGAASRKRRAAGQSSALREGPPLIGVDFRIARALQSRSALERAPRGQVVATQTRRRAVRPQAARSVANRSKRSTERQSRRGHCVGVNAATTTNIWARDPDVQRVDAPPLFGEGERALECVSPLRWAEDRCPSRVTATGTSSSCIVHGRAVRRHRCSH